ncbi:hypothetical protein [Haloarchaeobius sp. DYHT-AS-18]|uniref:hypothetical protein n=1 Tax=Haloarchaeobius sp. DYHT-AS-18 TaxID=3446117 RepID=UPI003EB7C7E1
MDSGWDDSDRLADDPAESADHAGAAASTPTDVDAIRSTLRELLAEDLSRGTLLRVRDTVTDLVDALPEDQPPTVSSVNLLLDVVVHVSGHEFAASGASFGLETLSSEIVRTTSAALATAAEEHPRVVLDARYPVLQDVFGDADRAARRQMARFFAALLQNDADTVMTTPAIDAAKLARHAVVLLAATNLPAKAFLDRKGPSGAPMQAAAFIIWIAAEHATERVDGFLSERIVGAMPPEYVSTALVDVTLAALGKSALATPNEYLDDFTQLLHSDTAPLRQKRPGARAVGVYAALAPDADVRDTAKTLLASILRDHSVDSNTARAAISGYEAILQYDASRLSLPDIELLRAWARAQEGFLVAQDALECLSNVVVEADKTRHATAAFDGLIEALEGGDPNRTPFLMQRVERVFGQLFAADVPRQTERTLRKKCRTYITDTTFDDDTDLGVRVLREAASTTPRSTTLDDCKETVTDDSARWYERLVAAETAVVLAPEATDATVQNLIRAFVDVIATASEPVTLTTVLADQGRDLLGTVDDPDPLPSAANRLCAVLVDGTRATPVRHRAARLLKQLVQKTGHHPFSPAEVAVLASMARSEGTPDDIREALLMLVPKLLETVNHPGLELYVVNQLSDVTVGDDDTARLSARMRFDQGLRELLTETTSPVVQASILERFRQGIQTLPMMHLMPSVIGLAEYVGHWESRDLRRQYIEGFVPIVLDADEDESARLGATQAIKTLVAETTNLGFDGELVESLYSLVEAPPTSIIADEPLGLRQRGVDAFSTALAAAEDVGALGHLASDVADRIDDADPTVRRSLLTALAVFAEDDPQIVAPHSEVIRRGIRDTDLDPSLRCRLVDAVTRIGTPAATVASSAD